MLDCTLKLATSGSDHNFNALIPFGETAVQLYDLNWEMGADRVPTDEREILNSGG